MKLVLKLTAETEHFYEIAADCAYHFANRYRGGEVQLGRSNYHMYWKRTCSVMVYATKTSVVAIPSLDVYPQNEIVNETDIDPDDLSGAVYL